MENIDQVTAMKNFNLDLDLEMVEMIMDKNVTFKDLPKEKFIEFLKLEFLKLQKLGNECIIAKKGKCYKDINPDLTGFGFKGNKTNHFFNLFFETKNNKITEIVEYEVFESKDGSLRPYSTDENGDWSPF